MRGGFRYSPLKLNEGLGAVEQWDEAAIQARAEKLSEQAARVWEAPSLPADMLAAYQAKSSLAGIYTIHTHPYLVSGPMAEVFSTLRCEILALDPAVTEEFLKLYVAYKAETNFVDVVPQAKRLRLSLNMRFYEIHDPRGLCKDVSDLGRWGNGDVEIAMSDLSELPYVMGLVRQSLEKQLGNNELAL